MSNKQSVTRGSGNIFADIGLPNADEHMLKARIVVVIGDLISERHLSQRAAAERMGLAQPDVSKLLRGHLEGFSLERLLGLVRMLGRDVEIAFKKPPNQGAEERKGRILVRA